jgi:hypothetical protein
MKEEDGIARLEAKLDTLIRLVGLTVASGLQSVKERAVILNRAGLGPREIAALCDTTPNTVSVALSNAKRDAKPKATESKE